MADTDLDATYGFSDKRIGRGATGASVLTEAANYDTINDMRTRLAAINGTTYTAARLNQMTRNDMTYALRIESDSAGIR
jgi:hypothetical protein